MKFFRIAFVAALVASLAANAFFWQRLSQQRTEAESLRAASAEADALRAENEALKKQNAPPSGSVDAENRELARLRNEVGQLRKQTAEAAAQRASEAAQLRAQLATANQNLAQKEKDVEALKVTGEQADQLQQTKQRAQFNICMNNLKQIGLAARLWANNHGEIFPPDFFAMRNELGSPKVLFCPASPAALQVADWSQLNPSTISYQYLNPNGSPADPQKLLTTCPIHGHVGLSDGSVQAKRLQP